MEGRSRGAWEADEQVGEGGMGVVYEAERADEPRAARCGEVVKRWMIGSRRPSAVSRGAQIFGGLQHPNIARCRWRGDGGWVALTMRWILSKASLSTNSARRTILPFAKVGDVPRVCDAVAYAHAQGIVQSRSEAREYSGAG